MTNWGSMLGDVLKNYGGVPQSPADVQDIPHNQVYDHYQQFAQQATPDQVYNAHQQAYQQFPQPQQQSLFNSVVGALSQQGVSPQQAGAQGNFPSAENYGQIAQYVSQNAGLMQNVFGQNGALNSPLAKMALAGALAVAASKFSQSGNKGTNKDNSNMSFV